MCGREGPRQAFRGYGPFSNLSSKKCAPSSPPKLPPVAPADPANVQSVASVDLKEAVPLLQQNQSHCAPIQSSKFLTQSLLLGRRVLLATAGAVVLLLVLASGVRTRLSPATSGKETSAGNSEHSAYTLAPVDRKPSVTFHLGGNMKCGTTALFTLLQTNPSIGMPPSKELQFFNNDLRDWSDPVARYEEYEHYWDDTPANVTVRGEATPITIFWPGALERMKAYNSEMRLILIYRDPVKRAYSAWKMETLRKTEDQPFSWAIREGRERLKTVSTRHWTYVERGFYGKMLEHAFTVFPRDQILLLRNEDLDQDAQGVVNRVAHFLGLPDAPPLPAQHHYFVAPDQSTISAEDCEYLRDIFREDTALFGRLSGLDISGWQCSEGK